MSPSRRRLLQAATVWPLLRTLHAGRKDFWETKEPAAWTAEEKLTVLGQSPWAQEGSARVEREKMKTGPYQGVARPGAGVPGAKPNARPGELESVPMGEKLPPPPSAETGPLVQFRVLARWETAAPVRLAGGPDLPDGAAPYYVIRLRGMPLMPPPKPRDGEPPSNPNADLIEEVKQNTRIERKDKPAIACAHLFTGSGTASTDLLLFFPRADDPIVAADKLVTLESRFGPFHLSIKFPLKEMIYKGALAL
jgi:hypothetical protein